MLQSLLAERFHLRVHTVIEERPVYALILAKGGSKLSTATSEPSASDGRRYGSLGYTTTTQITAKDATLAMLTDWLSKQQEIGNRIVVDETGLTGRYDFVLSGVPAPQPNAQASSRSLEAPTTSLFTHFDRKIPKIPGSIDSSDNRRRIFPLGSIRRSMVDSGPSSTRIALSRIAAARRHLNTHTKITVPNPHSQIAIRTKENA